MSLFKYLKELDRKQPETEAFVKRVAGGAKHVSHGVEMPPGTVPSHEQPHGDAAVHPHDQPPKDVSARPSPGRLGEGSKGPRDSTGYA
jgi:hypothetical protein